MSSLHQGEQGDRQGGGSASLLSPLPRRTGRLRQRGRHVFVSWESSRIIIIFTSVHRVCWEGEGVKGRRSFLKNIVCSALQFSKGVSKSTFSKYSFSKGVTKNLSTLCTLLIMLTILDDPLHVMSGVRVL